MTYTHPVIHHLLSVDTVMHAARIYFDKGELPIWASVISDEQSAGRGQYGRHWVSPKGNIYACMRLPFAAPFLDTRCGISVSSIVAAKLELLGMQSAIKWPNDIVLNCHGDWHKVAGILIDQKGSALFAGIGINVAVAPQAKDMREDAALPAACLRDCGLHVTPLQLWFAISEYFANLDLAAFAVNWKHFAEKRLLWKNQKVSVTSNDKEIKGILYGLGSAGELLIERQGAIASVAFGSLHKQ